MSYRRNFRSLGELWVDGAQPPDSQAGTVFQETFPKVAPDALMSVTSAALLDGARPSFRPNRTTPSLILSSWKRRLKVNKGELQVVSRAEGIE